MDLEADDGFIFGVDFGRNGGCGGHIQVQFSNLQSWELGAGSREQGTEMTFVIRAQESEPPPPSLWDSGKYLIRQEFWEGRFGLWHVDENEPPCLGLLARDGGTTGMVERGAVWHEVSSRNGKGRAWQPLLLIVV